MQRIVSRAKLFAADERHNVHLFVVVVVVVVVVVNFVSYLLWLGFIE
jgi:hypothetical protein